jgi:hypothetical protein
MKQDSSLSPEQLKRMADNQATAMLMEQWVRDNVKEVAFALSDIVPFICGECNISDLKDRLNTVNVTFASVALNVIKQRNEAEEEDNKHMPMCLPCDATEMDNALYDLSRFLKKFKRLGSLLERNETMPAFRMAISNDNDVDSI